MNAINEQKTGASITNGESELIDRTTKSINDNAARQAGIVTLIKSVSFALLSESSNAESFLYSSDFKFLRILSKVKQVPITVNSTVSTAKVAIAEPTGMRQSATSAIYSARLCTSASTAARAIVKR